MNQLQVEELQCPVYPHTEKFNDEQSLIRHLEEKHQRAIKKYGLQNMVDFAREAKNLGWFSADWRRVQAMMEAAQN